MDKRLIVIVGIVIAFLIFSYPILAAATAAPVVIERDGQGRPTVIVEQGRGKDAGLVRVTHIDYTKPDGKPQPGTKTDSCFKLAQWKWLNLPILYKINSTGIPGGPDLPFIINTINDSDSAWDNATPAPLFIAPVIETGQVKSGDNDGINYISFEDNGPSGIIAVANTWYTIGKTKEAIDSDILFNTYYTWGDVEATGNFYLMDLQNIATHEIGHTLGLSDTYSKPCGNVTMYGYSTEGETSKRTLELPDIAGLQKIYGAYGG